MAETKKITLAEKLLGVQAELKAPKSQFNKFGNYAYRSAEDIVEAVKPLAKEKRVLLTLSDSVESVGSRIYIKATAAVTDIDDPAQVISVTAYAREAEARKGMDDSQITGSASSYARKYALNGLFAIDDTKDADSSDNREPAQFKCTRCGVVIKSTEGKDGKVKSPEEIFRACGGLCPECYVKAKRAAEQAPAPDEYPFK